MARVGGWLGAQVSSSFLGAEAPRWRHDEQPRSMTSRVLRGILSALTFPFRLVGLGVLGLVSGLYEIALRIVQPFGRARLLHFAAGIPALAVGCFAIALAIATQAQKDDLMSLYQSAALAAKDAEEYAAAEVYWRRMIDERQDHEAQFHLAEVLEKTNRGERAIELMRALAPTTRRGFVKAHRALAIRMATGLSVDAPQVHVDEVHWHLSNAGESDSPEINLAWAQYSLVTRQTEKAIGHLRKAAEHWPEMHHLLGEVYFETKRMDLARDEYHRALSHYSEQVKANPLNHLARSDMANILMRMNRNQEAVEVLRQGLDIDSRAPLNGLMALALMQIFDRAKAADKPDYSQMLKLLEAAFQYDPANPDALQRLTSLGQRATPEGRQRLRRLLADGMAEGQTPAMGHFALGVLDYMDRNLDSATWHLEQALRLNDNLPLVKNNLAMLLAEREEPDLERASELISQALATFPDNSRFLDTLGFVQAKQGKLDDAVTTYERALATARPTEARGIHSRLADLYEQIGKPTLAEAHRKHAEGQ